MKKILIGTSALVGAGLIAGQAVAADGIKLSVGGFFRTAYLLNFDDNRGYGSSYRGAEGHDRNIDGLYSDAEIHFKGETTLDNGVTVGVRVELEGEEDDNDQIDEAYTYFKGGFGELRIGSDDEALAANCVTPPGSTANFGAFSPNQVGAAYVQALGFTGSNTVCTGVEGDANKFVYFSPTFAGFQLALSYTPDAQAQAYNSDADDFNNTGGPHIGQNGQDLGDRSHDFSAYLTYNYEGDGFGVTWGGGASFSGRVENGGNATLYHDGSVSNSQDTGTDAYQTGLNVSFGGFKVGAAFQYFDLNAGDANSWVVGTGVSYNVDAWTVGFQYSHQQANGLRNSEFGTTFIDDVDRSADRFVLTGIYNFGPGIDIEAELGYTTTESDDRYSGIGNPVHERGGPGNDYDAFEIGVGTAITF